MTTRSAFIQQTSLDEVLIRRAGGIYRIGVKPFLFLSRF